MLSYLIPLALLVGAWFAIRHFATRGSLSLNTAKWLTWGLYAVAALLVLSALGVCPGQNPTGLDPLLNRPAR